MRLATHLLVLKYEPSPRKKKKATTTTREILEKWFSRAPFFFAIFAFYKALQKLPPAKKEKREWKRVKFDIKSSSRKTEHELFLV